MLRTYERTRDFTDVQRLIAIAVFTVLTILAAKIQINTVPVPFTMQPLVVILAGMVLGGRDGALAMFGYVSLIALGLPFDANGLGTAALFGPTGGYLIGFIAAAGVVGMIVENLPDHFVSRFVAGVIGVAVIYLFGVVVLKNIQSIALEETVSWSTAWAWGAKPFVGLDLVKVVIAAGLTESARRLLIQQWQNATKSKNQ